MVKRTKIKNGKKEYKRKRRGREFKRNKKKPLEKGKKKAQSKHMIWTL